MFLRQTRMCGDRFVSVVRLKVKLTIADLVLEMRAPGLVHFEKMLGLARAEEKPFQFGAIRHLQSIWAERRKSVGSWGSLDVSVSSCSRHEATQRVRPSEGSLKFCLEPGLEFLQRGHECHDERILLRDGQDVLHEPRQQVDLFHGDQRTSHSGEDFDSVHLRGGPLGDDGF